MQKAPLPIRHSGSRRSRAIPGAERAPAGRRDSRIAASTRRLRASRSAARLPATSAGICRSPAEPPDRQPRLVHAGAAIVPAPRPARTRAARTTRARRARTARRRSPRAEPAKPPSATACTSDDRDPRAPRRARAVRGEVREDERRSRSPPRRRPVPADHPADERDGNGQRTNRAQRPAGPSRARVTGQGLPAIPQVHDVDRRRPPRRPSRWAGTAVERPTNRSTRYPTPPHTRIPASRVPMTPSRRPHPSSASPRAPSGHGRGQYSRRPDGPVKSLRPAFPQVRGHFLVTL